jgi:hypothetical protein
MFCVTLKIGMMTKSRALYYEVISLHIRIAKESYDNFVLILKMSLKSYTIKECIKAIYNDFLPIETLSKEEKSGLWDEINKLFPDYTKDQKIELCRNMYVIGNLF